MLLNVRHKKTGSEYEIIQTGIDATNERSGLKVIIYKKIGGNLIFVREEEEFWEKFESI